MDKKKLLVMSVSFGLAVALTAAAAGVYAEGAESDIARGVIRFHVLANSDAGYDQALKLKVRDAVLAEMSPLLSGAGNPDQSAAVIADNIPAIERTAEDAVKANGYAYPVRAALADDMFPTKSYGDVTFPAGVYKALRVEIGAAKGHNWWCVMFPPLCFAESGDAALSPSSKAELQSAMPDDAYALVTSQSRDIKVKFKLVEIFDSIINGNP